MRPLPTRHRRIELQVGSAIDVRGAREEIGHFLYQCWVQQVQQQDHGGDEVVAGRKTVGMIHLTPPAQNAHKCQRGDQYWEKQQASVSVEDATWSAGRRQSIDRNASAMLVATAWTANTLPNDFVQGMFTLVASVAICK